MLRIDQPEPWVVPVNTLAMVSLPLRSSLIAVACQGGGELKITDHLMMAACYFWNMMIELNTIKVQW